MGVYVVVGKGWLKVLEQSGSLALMIGNDIEDVAGRVAQAIEKVDGLRDARECACCLCLRRGMYPQLAQPTSRRGLWGP